MSLLRYPLAIDDFELIINGRKNDSQDRKCFTIKLYYQFNSPIRARRIYLNFQILWIFPLTFENINIIMMHE